MARNSDGFHRELELLAPEELESLLTLDFHSPAAEDGDMSALYHAAELLARREGPERAPDTERAWAVFREKYLPFAKAGKLLYGDAEAPAASAEAVQPPGRRRSLAGRIIRFAACLLLGIVLSTGLVLSVSSEARAAFAGWVRELYDSCFYYHYSQPDGGPKPASRLPICRPGWLPEGYVLEDTPQLHGQTLVIYFNEETADILSVSCVFSGAGGLYIDGETPAPVTVGGLPGDLYLPEEEDEAAYLVWDSGSLLFCVSAALPGETLTRIAESLELSWPVYCPGWIPEEYTLQMERNQSTAEQMDLILLFSDPDGRLLHFRCATPNGSAALQIKNKEGVKQAEVNGCPADLYLDFEEGAASHVIWIDSNENLLFWLTASLPEEELLRIAGSVRLTDPQPPLHRPSRIPEGFHPASEFSALFTVEQVYANPEGAEIAYFYTRSDQRREMRKNLEEAAAGLEPQAIQVGDCPGELYRAADGTIHLVWRNGEALYWLSGSLPEEALLDMAESVRVDQPAQP